MEQLPNWLAATVEAAGMAGAYNAEDWDLLADNHPSQVNPLFTPVTPAFPH